MASNFCIDVMYILEFCKFSLGNILDMLLKNCLMPLDAVKCKVKMFFRVLFVISGIS